MIIDSSALVALINEEPGHADLFDALDSPSSRPQMSAATYIEASTVVDGRRDAVLSRRFDELLSTYEVEIVPVTEAQARLAREAYRDFGRGSGHPAGLNFGDVFAYALAKATGEPLLFKGDDFAHTDVRAAV